MARSVVYLVARRLLATVQMAFILLTLIFLILRLLPGDPTAGVLPAEAPEEAREYLIKELGLDRPLYEQYFKYLNGLFTGRLGMSWSERRDVYETVALSLPTTLELTLVSMAVAIGIGVLVGAVSAIKADTSIDHSLRIFNVFWYSMPVIWLGPMMQLIFGIYLGILPVSGRILWSVAPPRITGLMVFDSIISGSLASLLDALKHLVLPCVTLGLIISSTISRITRGSLMDVLVQDYILLATAKGLSRLQVVFTHALKNASFPVITFIALEFGSLLAGAIVNESIFNLPGMGRVLIRALEARDFALLQGALSFSVIWVSIATFVVDVIYMALDPRVKTI